MFDYKMQSLVDAATKAMQDAKNNFMVGKPYIDAVKAADAYYLKPEDWRNVYIATYAAAGPEGITVGRNGKIERMS